jgi:hypothetical protein
MNIISNINQFSIEMINHVFSFVEYKDLGCMSQVCFLWKTILENQPWKSIRIENRALNIIQLEKDLREQERELESEWLKNQNYQDNLLSKPCKEIDKKRRDLNKKINLSCLEIGKLLKALEAIDPNAKVRLVEKIEGEEPSAKKQKGIESAK